MTDRPTPVAGSADGAPVRNSGHGGGKRKPLREVVCEIDRDILRLVLRRGNLLSKMRGSAPRLDPGEEKAIRSAWEQAVSHVSRDPRLSGNFFTLMQEITFLPRPNDETGTDAPRTAFNLAPPAKPVRLSMAAPLDSRAARAWLMLAAATGQPVRLTPCPAHDALADFIQMCGQAGAAVTRQGDAVAAKPAAPLGAPDKVLHAGDSAWNFFLMLAHYLGRPGRAKFTGGAALKLADLSGTRHFLPALGARLVPIVPRSEGLPARLECSGILPDTVDVPAQVPADLAAALLLAAPGYERPLRLNLAGHPRRDDILSRMLPILRAAHASARAEGGAVLVEPGPLSLPADPALDMEAELAAYLLAFPLALGGEVQLGGRWPASASAQAAWDYLRACGLDLRSREGDVTARAAAPLRAAPPRFPGAPARWTPLAAALAACAALRGAADVLPPQHAPQDTAVLDGFWKASGVAENPDGTLCKNSQEGQTFPWNAPSPAWALALSLSACANPHRKLGNPGIMAALHSGFWALYNALPEPRPAAAATEAPAPPSRRRIRTAAVAVVPPEPSEDE